MKRLLYFIPFLLLLNSCTILTREAIYWDADIDDYKIFPSYKFKENTQKFNFYANQPSILDTMFFENSKGKKQSLNDLLTGTKTHQFIVIQNDSILFEWNCKTCKRSDYSTLFSTSKSVTSLEA